jgi:hypothetical protein
MRGHSPRSAAGAESTLPCRFEHPAPRVTIAAMFASIEVSNEFYAGWGTLSLVNAGLAQGKGRSGLNWFLLSLLSGPVATFFLVALFDRLPAR